MNKKKKSQMEIFGIAFIVILLVFGLIFFVGSKIKKQKSAKDSYLATEVAQNLLNSMFKATSVTGLSVEDCVQDIVETNNKCTRSGTDTSLKYTRDIIDIILRQTVELWGRKYRLTIKQNNENIKSVSPDSQVFTPIDGGCRDLDEKEAPGRLFLPAKGGTIIIVLEICK
ncbi:hypothetical protein JXB41_04450 [Candidatus Woesearchaeota archaeon]|nr:hypothetical protein [Candidatus Woesearchaeota archaeon]